MKTLTVNVFIKLSNYKYNNSLIKINDLHGEWSPPVFPTNCRTVNISVIFLPLEYFNANNEIINMCN